MQFKHLITAVFLAIMASYPLANDGRVWSGNDKVNPTAGQVLVTSGAIYEGPPTGAVLKVRCVISSTVTAGVQFQLRDEGGTPVVTIKYGVAANVPSDLIDFEIDVPNNHSLNIINTSAVTGTVHAHILARIITGY